MSAFEYGFKVAANAAQSQGDGERVSRLNELAKEFNLKPDQLKKRGSLDQKKVDLLIATVVFDVGSAGGAGLRDGFLDGPITALQGRSSEPAIKPEKQYLSTSNELQLIVPLADDVRKAILKGQPPKYQVAGALNEAIDGVGTVAGSAITTGKINLGEAFGVLSKLKKSATQVAQLQPAKKTTPLSPADIFKAEVAMVAKDGVPEADAKFALAVIGQMKGYVPPDKQKVFDLAEAKVRGNVMKAAPGSSPDAKPAKASPSPAVAPDATLGDGNVECTPLQTLEKAKAALTGTEGPNCKMPEAKPTAPGGGFSLGGG